MEARQVTNTNTTEFGDLIFVNTGWGWNTRQAIVKFDNGCMASVIIGDHTHGGTDGLYEIAIFGADGEIDYSTTITDDVIGNLTEQEVSETLVMIKNL